MDVDPPVFTFVPVDVSIDCAEDNIPLDPATATDNCTETTVEVSLDILGACPEPYEIVRVFTATDACGNTATASQTIFITNDPGSSCPGDLDGDLFVGVSDVLTVLGEFGCASGCSVDPDQDGATTVNDVLTILSAFGDACL